MTDFECLMQLMGKDAKTEIKEFMQDIVDETERELREQYKERIKAVLERELLKALQLDEG